MSASEEPSTFSQGRWQLLRLPSPPSQLALWPSSTGATAAVPFSPDSSVPLANAASPSPPSAQPERRRLPALRPPLVEELSAPPSLSSRNDGLAAAAPQPPSAEDTCSLSGRRLPTSRQLSTASGFSSGFSGGAGVPCEEELLEEQQRRLEALQFQLDWTVERSALSAALRRRESQARVRLLQRQLDEQSGEHKQRVARNEALRQDAVGLLVKLRVGGADASSSVAVWQRPAAAARLAKCVDALRAEMRRQLPEAAFARLQKVNGLGASPCEASAKCVLSGKSCSGGGASAEKKEFPAVADTRPAVACLYTSTADAAASREIISARASFFSNGAADCARWQRLLSEEGALRADLSAMEKNQATVADSPLQQESASLAVAEECDGDGLSAFAVSPVVDKPIKRFFPTKENASQSKPTPLGRSVRSAPSPRPPTAAAAPGPPPTSNEIESGAGAPHWLALVSQLQALQKILLVDRREARLRRRRSEAADEERRSSAAASSSREFESRKEGQGENRSCLEKQDEKEERGRASSPPSQLTKSALRREGGRGRRGCSSRCPRRGASREKMKSSNAASALASESARRPTAAALKANLPSAPDSRSSSSSSSSPSSSTPDASSRQEASPSLRLEAATPSSEDSAAVHRVPSRPRSAQSREGSTPPSSTSVRGGESFRAGHARAEREERQPNLQSEEKTFWRLPPLAKAAPAEKLRPLALKSETPLVSLTPRGPLASARSTQEGASSVCVSENKDRGLAGLGKTPPLGEKSATASSAQKQQAPALAALLLGL